MINIIILFYGFGEMALLGHGMFLLTQRNASGYNTVLLWKDQDVIRTRECCCESMKMNIVEI